MRTQPPRNAKAERDTRPARDTDVSDSAFTSNPTLAHTQG